jgi:hypothetical protein
VVIWSPRRLEHRVGKVLEGGHIREHQDKRKPEENQDRENPPRAGGCQHITRSLLIAHRLKITDAAYRRPQTGYALRMTEESQRSLGWVIGALAMLTAVALYLWISTPEEALLPATYTVM